MLLTYAVAHAAVEQLTKTTAVGELLGLKSHLSTGLLMESSLVVKWECLVESCRVLCGAIYCCFCMVL